MCTFIGVESVVANALIELFEKQNIREVSFDTLVRYGTQVVRVLQKSSKDEVVLLLSRKYQVNMIENYSQFFEADFSQGNGVFRLRGDDREKTLKDLKAYFRWTLSVQVLRAFVSADALQELGVAV